MKLSIAAFSVLLASSNAFTSPLIRTTTPSSVLSPSFTTQNGQNTFLSIATADEIETENSTDDDTNELSEAGIKKFAFRELQSHCKKRGLPAVGTTAVLRERLMVYAGLCQVTGTEECDVEDETPVGITFTDDSDPDFDFNSMNRLILEKCELGHWKTAVRKLKQLKRRHATPDRRIPRDTYVKVLEVCVEDRLHGARAAEPARKVLEEMTDLGYDIPIGLGNQCVLHCLGSGPQGTHDGFGGIDPALAMLSAMQSVTADSGPSVSTMTDNTSIVQLDTYGAVVSALAKDGAVDEALLLLRAMVVEHCFTPPLSVFANTAMAASKRGGLSESVLQVLSLAKAAGYELDSIGSAEAGRNMLASGVIAAEQLGNLSLGLRLLTAAGKAEGCAPDRGDDLVAASSAAAQRASTLIHKRAIDRAVEDDIWKLAVKLLELMPQRSLTPSTSVWRKVVTICAKAEKSRRATSILFDWVKFSQEGKAEKPPVKVFNTVINTCEICGEEELTQAVLDSMRQTHDTDGNIITFNIALKRLAKLGAARPCEGIIIGMLQSGIEPSVVSYTTAIGACVGSKDPALAMDWLQRMKSRDVKPNFHTYNTAMAACLDGKLESTIIGSKIAAEMIADVDRELETGFKGNADFKSVLPDTYTKLLAKKLSKQLRENWRSDEINMTVAKSTIRVPLLQLLDFNKSEAAERVKKQMEENKMNAVAVEEHEEENLETVEDDETELEYKAVNQLHKQGSRVAEV